LFGEDEDVTGNGKPASSKEEIPQNPQVRKVLEQLKIETPTHIDDLLERLEDVSSSEAIAALFELEMTGAVRQLPGKNFVKVW
jgi:DNA processing protein